MPTAEKTYPGVYCDGDSWLHRFDARLKLLLLLVVVVSLFSASSGWRLLPLLLLWLLAARGCSRGWRNGLRVVAMLRWLLLFTLLMHLFFTPGRTLFGTSWLSLDGLLRGLLIDGQLLLAVLFSMLLAWTTRPERLAWALTSLLSPLQRLRVPVREAGGMLVLVLQFFPLIREEVAVLQPEAPAEKGLAGIKARAGLVAPLLLRLVDRADQLAVEMTATENNQPGVSVHDRRLTRFDWLLFAAGAIFLIVLWTL
ncbi:energy-coupling factor transport system permease protein [Malonomonas rubra DSM 5091]|uniref:Energy-coupling factor transport system permease protein n=1 Tax=Malonomonas rubra DSM 5091 TaxID=1122189 RepID=A0A1M6CF43_MALRU|nr:energy-coupling factor transporter transmembrane protein EcfT [Malonomonas rubra]SHI59606.1 energy-coupling factor transport system permease protein [Malonomonas rubra DSM 5091]